MSERSWVVHLLGHPAAGKRTVGVELVAASERAGPSRFVLIDNHLTSNPVLAVLDQGGVGTVGDDVWDRVDEVRDVVLRAIVELAPPERTFVFTNVAVEGRERSLEGVRRIERLAADRDSTYVPVVLHCDRDELLRRVPNVDRRTHGKWTAPDEVAAHLDRTHLYRPGSPHRLELDTTTASPATTARAILAHLSSLSTEG